MRFHIVMDAIDPQMLFPVFQLDEDVKLTFWDMFRIQGDDNLFLLGISPHQQDPI